MAIFSNKISQGSVAMHLRCSGMFYNDYFKFTSESSVKNFENQHLVKLRAKVMCWFFDSQCICCNS